MIRVGWLLFAILWTSVSVGAVEQDILNKGRIVISPERTVNYACRVKASNKLNQERILVQNGKSKAEVPVILAVYGCSVVSTESASAKSDRETTILEIRADNAGVTYSWSIAFPLGVSSVQVFSSIGGCSYAVVTSWDSVFVEDITIPRSREEALREVWTPSRLNTRASSALIPDTFVGRKAFDSLDDRHQNILVRNLYTDSSGDLNIDIVGKDPNKVYTFVQRNSKWELKENN